MLLNFNKCIMSTTKSLLSLKQFMLRQEVLKLYKRFFKAINQVSDEQYRAELKQWARTDFRSNSHHTDELTIKMMLNYGERSLKELETSIQLAK